MAGYWRLGMAALLSAGLTAGAAQAQALQHGEVLGNWTLRMTPSEGRGAVTVKTASGRVEMPLIVTQREQSGIACVLDGEAADCRLHRGGLVVVVNADGGRMTYTLTNRRGAGFTGNARVSHRLIPFGSLHLGAIDLTRR